MFRHVCVLLEYFTNQVDSCISHIIKKEDDSEFIKRRQITFTKFFIILLKPFFTNHLVKIKTTTTTTKLNHKGEL